MSHPPHHDSSAARGPAVWLDSGAAIGLVVVDSNRPAIGTATAPGLRKQSGAANH